MVQNLKFKVKNKQAVILIKRRKKGKKSIAYC